MEPKIISQFFLSLTLFIILFVIFSFTGCTDHQYSVDEIVSEYKANLSSVDSYSMNVTRTAPDSSQNIEILYKRPYQYRLSHRADPNQYDPNGRIWIQYVNNLTYFNYYPKSNIVDILPINNPETCFPLIDDPYRLAEPVLFSDNYNRSSSGLGIVNGRESYTIDATNVGPIDYFREGKAGKVRLWIDREYPLVTRIQAFDSSGNLKSTYEVKNFTINPNIPNGEFIVSYPNRTKIDHPAPFC